MDVTNILFYFCVMSLFILEGWLLSWVLPFHAAENSKELLAKRLVPLDGLRGVLALGVFFTHAITYWFYEQTGLWHRAPSNFYSQLAVAPVSMFFFITGYLFWSKLMLKPKFSSRAFWLGRLGRLGPLYAFACLCVFLFAACASGFHLHVSIVKLFSQLGAWLAFIPDMDLNAVSGSSLWLTSAWSLRYEWCFYLSLPFLGWFARRRAATLLLLCAAAGAGLLLSTQSDFGAMGKANKFIENYCDYFAYTFSVGILVAMLPMKNLARWASGVSATFLSIVAFSIAFFFVPAKYGLLESACLAVPFACVCLGNNWFGLLSSRPMRFLGRISYSLYLLHCVGLAVAMLILKKHGLLDGIQPWHYWTIVSGIGMTIILVCAFTYQWLEYPFLHLGKSSRVKELPKLEFLSGAVLTAKE